MPDLFFMPSVCIRAWEAPQLLAQERQKGLGVKVDRGLTTIKRAVILAGTFVSCRQVGEVKVHC